MVQCSSHYFQHINSSNHLFYVSCIHAQFGGIVHPNDAKCHLSERRNGVREYSGLEQVRIFLPRYACPSLLIMLKLK